MAHASRVCAVGLSLLAALVLRSNLSLQAQGLVRSPVLSSFPPLPFTGSPVAPAEPERELAEAAALSEGLGATGAPLWHLVGLRGQGVRVGIVDEGFAGHVALLGAALPEHVAARTFVDGEDHTHLDSGSAHGAAIAEIVHRIAPEAELYLAKIATPDDLHEAVAWLVGEIGVQVLHTSPLWYTLSPGDGTGFLADLVADVRAQGVVWVAPAGDARLLHWSGAWRSNEADGRLVFAEEENSLWLMRDGQYLLPPGLQIEAWMSWSDWEQADQDLDVCLFRGEDVNEMDCGDAIQQGLGGDIPTERLAGMTYGAPTVYGLYVRRRNGDRPLHVDIYVSGVTALAHRTEGQSLANIADAPGAIAVSAVGPSAPYAQAPYSSQGPTKGPGGVAEGGAPKPDLAAYAGVPTLSQGVLEGTAAAAAHVAGAAALVRGAHPAYGPDEVYAFFAQRAVDLGAPGWDPVYGHGRLYLGAPPLPPPVQRWVPVGMR
jgi:subtilisin family serine protease